MNLFSKPNPSFNDAYVFQLNISGADIIVTFKKTLFNLKNVDLDALALLSINGTPILSNTTDEDIKNSIQNYSNITPEMWRQQTQKPRSSLDLIEKENRKRQRNEENENEENSNPQIQASVAPTINANDVDMNGQDSSNNSSPTPKQGGKGNQGKKVKK
jgi:hypothetical protein